MTDELNMLAGLNPVASEELEQAVAVDRSALLEMLAADGDSNDSGRGNRGPGRPRLRVVGTGRRSRTDADAAVDRSFHRVGYAAALVVAAAATVVAVMLGADQPTAEPELVDPADDAAPVVSVVIEEADDRQPPTTPLIAGGIDQEGNGSENGSGAGADASSAITEPDQTDDVDDGDDGDDEVGADGQPSTNAGGPPVTAPPIDGPFDRATDLLSLHFDHSNRDDGHAAAAALELMTWFDLEPHVVSGTAPLDAEYHVQPYRSLMTTIWQDRWFDAGLDRPGAVATTAQRWLATIDAGGRVWVAEGGVADFTADVLREMAGQRPDLDTVASVNVIQHNGRNETESKPDNLQLVMERSTYTRIDDGNSGNGTADLNQADDTFTSAALAGRHRDIWAAAFEYRPSDELDFSDTVEVLHILGIETDQVADPADFATRFIN